MKDWSENLQPNAKSTQKGFHPPIQQQQKKWQQYSMIKLSTCYIAEIFTNKSNKAALQKFSTEIWGPNIHSNHRMVQP